MNKPFEPYRFDKVSAADILIETITDKPALFSGRTHTVKALRDEIIHEYDILRLELSYESTQGVTQALIAAINSLGWIQVVGGSGVETEFKVRIIPDRTPDTLNDAVEQLEDARKALQNWKDMGLALNDALITLRSLKATTEHAQCKLNDALSLAAMYRMEAKEHNPHFKDPTREDIEQFKNNPKEASESRISDLRAIHGLL